MAVEPRPIPGREVGHNTLYIDCRSTLQSIINSHSLTRNGNVAFPMVLGKWEESETETDRDTGRTYCMKLQAELMIEPGYRGTVRRFP